MTRFSDPCRDQIETLYRALWRALQVAGAEPCYYSPEWLPGLDLEGGRFVANAERADGKPEIRLPRTRVPVEPYEPDVDRLDHEALLGELCILAHEGGHFRSDRAGNTPAGYDDMVLAIREGRRKPTEDAKRAILEEETRAWALGRELLEYLGFEAWDVFEEKRAAALGSYEAALAAVGK